MIFSKIFKKSISTVLVTSTILCGCLHNSCMGTSKLDNVIKASKYIAMLNFSLILGLKLGMDYKEYKNEKYKDEYKQNYKNLFYRYLSGDNGEGKNDK